MDELESLCEAVIEERLTADQAARLEQIVGDDPEARRFFLDYLHQHACLEWSAAVPAFLSSPSPFEPAGAFADEGDSKGLLPLPANPLRRRRWVRRAFRTVGGLTAAAALILGAWFGLRPGTDRRPAPVATLIDGKECQWGSGSLPTEIGSRLSAGRLRLAEGVARIAFADGAEITLEAPAELELVSPKRCILHAGRLVAKVPPGAIGFMVDTPTAVIEDLGTEFGVNVRKGRSADVHVFNGLVDVRHRQTGRVEHMRTGANLRFAPGDVTDFDPLAEPPAPGGANVWAGGGATRLIQVSTGTGRGKDAYVRPPFEAKIPAPEALLLVKNTKHDIYAAKAYIGLDLTPAAGMRIVEAQLSLAFAPTGMGFASEVPDATFAVYGLTDESLEDWDERTIRWDNAPANRTGGTALDPDRVVLLGRFVIAQGVLYCLREVSGAALVDFLNRDTNSRATLIVIRETMGSGRTDLVHGFAGKHHPELPPPTLKLKAVPRSG